MTDAYEVAASRVAADFPTSCWASDEQKQEYIEMLGGMIAHRRQENRRNATIACFWFAGIVALLAVKVMAS